MSGRSDSPPRRSNVFFSPRSPLAALLVLAVAVGALVVGQASAAYGPPHKAKTIKAEIQVSNAVDGYRLVTAHVHGTKIGSRFTILVNTDVVHRGTLASSSIHVRLHLKLHRGDRLTVRSGGKVLAALRL